MFKHIRPIEWINRAKSLDDIMDMSETEIEEDLDKDLERFQSLMTMYVSLRNMVNPHEQIVIGSNKYFIMLMLATTPEHHDRKYLYFDSIYRCFRKTETTKSKAYYDNISRRIHELLGDPTPENETRYRMTEKMDDLINIIKAELSDMRSYHSCVHAQALIIRQLAPFCNIYRNNMTETIGITKDQLDDIAESFDHTKEMQDFITDYMTREQRRQMTIMDRVEAKADLIEREKDSIASTPDLIRIRDVDRRLHERTMELASSVTSSRIETGEENPS